MPTEMQECRVCHKKVVHPNRTFKICLDCIVAALAMKGIIPDVSKLM